MAQTVNDPACDAGDPGLIPGSGRYPGEGNGNFPSFPVFLTGKSHGQKSLVSCSPWGRKELGTTGQLTLAYLRQYSVPLSLSPFALTKY